MDRSKLMAHVISSTRLDRGGPSLSATQLLESQRQAGVEGVLVCPDHQKDSTRFASVSTSVYPEVESLLQTESADRIRGFHLHGIWDWFLHQSVRAAKRRGIPYVISPRGMLEPWALSQKKWKKRIAWWLYQRSDLQGAAFLHATAVSEAQQFSKLGLRNSVVVLPNGVSVLEVLDSNEVSPSREPPLRSKQALFLSRIHPKKGLLVLAEAWAKVQPKGWRMVVIGPDEGGHRMQVQSLVNQLGLQSSWEIRDAVYGEQKRQAFQDSQLFILPTFSENFGIAVAEALAYGLPVITTTEAPWSGLVAHRCGWWTPMTVAGIAQALEQATSTDVSELRQMGQRGNRWVRDEFAWSSIGKRLVAAYDKYIS